MYKNELYAGGTFYNSTTTDTVRGIIKYNGTNWVSVGGGLQGLNSRVISMTIFNNELYVGGWFTKIDGNIGQNLMKWDGSKWYDVGFNSDNCCGVSKLYVHHNKLWVTGSFYSVANMPAFTIAPSTNESPLVSPIRAPLPAPAAISTASSAPGLPARYPLSAPYAPPSPPLMRVSTSSFPYGSL